MNTNLFLQDKFVDRPTGNDPYIKSVLRIFVSCNLLKLKLKLKVVLLLPLPPSVAAMALLFLLPLLLLSSSSSLLLSLPLPRHCHLLWVCATCYRCYQCTAFGVILLQSLFLSISRLLGRLPWWRDVCESVICFRHRAQFPHNKSALFIAAPILRLCGLLAWSTCYSLPPLQAVENVLRQEEIRRQQH